MAVMAFSYLSCAGDPLFMSISSQQLASPVFVAVDTVNSRAYVINANNHLEYLDTHLTILDISNPPSPTFLDVGTNPISIPNFSGQAYFDPATRLLFVSNRLSDHKDDVVDTLLRINVDETSGSFGEVSSFNAGEDPFGVACCDTSNRLYLINEGTLGVYDIGSPSTFVSISLDITLGSGDRLKGLSSREVVLLGDQAFVTNRTGFIYVINMTEVGDLSKNPIDYVISGGGDLRGIATDGTYLYVVDHSEDDPLLRILDPSSLTAVDPDTSAFNEVSVTSIQTTAISTGTEPQEVAIVGGRAFVTNTGSDSVTVIDTDSRSVATTIDLTAGGWGADEPTGITGFTVGDNNYVYVTNLKSDNISIIDANALSVVADYP
ncbi:MAG: hypothetical protein A3I75_04240 [Deltaproteobacteria bacterium RIFCSPLOWO2_02_FULL_50_16]|nr:MAG: hypothetical protein A3I75_04240 [Deltaproteobacteria bacterium RIFCSPLOWO2_02_FULL_50_16]